MMSGRVLAALILVGCGPLIGVPAEETSGGTEADATSSPDTSSTTSTPTTTVAVTTSTSDPSTTTFDPSSSGEDVSTGCLGFICDPTETWGAECSVWEQDCPDGDKCMPWANDGGNAWNSTICSPIADNPAAPGEPCMAEGSATSGIDNCDGTSMCFADPMTLQGTCRAFCLGDESNAFCANECEVCPLSSDGVLTICLPSCDPVAQECGEGSGCYAVYDTFLCAPDASGAAGAPGEACEYLNACDPGTLCLEGEWIPDCEGIGCCTPACTIGDSTPCEVLPGTECTALFDDGAGACEPTNVGVCTIPK